MGKIRLADGSELDILFTSTDQYCIAIQTRNFDIIKDYVNAFTRFNLSNANIINEDNEVVLTLRHKYVTGFDGTPLGDEDNDYMICFRLADIYSLEERITMLETENEQLRSSQEVQDEAIVELASIITE